MSIHDWTRVDAGIYHDFHCGWIQRIKDSLNEGVLPEGFYALTEQHGFAVQVDVLTLRDPSIPRENGGSMFTADVPGGTAVADAPPKVAVTSIGTKSSWYALKRRTVTIRHVSNDEVIALIEIVSPGNKDRTQSVDDFVRKCCNALAGGLHLLVVDLIPPNRHNPNGMHAEIWSRFSDTPYTIADDKRLASSSYDATMPITSYVQPLAVGDEMPAMPLFLDGGYYVDLPLGTTYNNTYAKMPPRWQRVIEGTHGQIE